MQTKSSLTFACALDCISLAEDYGRGDQITDCLRITNIKDSLLRQTARASLEKYIGSIEYDYLLRAPAIVWAHYDSAVDPHDEPACISVLNKHLAELSMFMNILWLSKDNCVSFDKGFLVASDGAMIRVAANSWDHSPTTAAGDRISLTTFSRSELRTVRRIFQATYSNDLAPEVTYVDPKYQPYGKELNVVLRFFYFLAAARSEAFVPVKIAHYCTCLEAVFLRDNQELSYKLAQRVAHFLTEDRIERLRIFDLVRRAYDIRSKTIHGSPIKHSPSEASKISVELDVVLRGVMLRIFYEPDLFDLFHDRDQSKFENAMNSMVFEVPTS